MTIWLIVLGVGVVLGASLTARVISERSLRLLTAEQKVLLIDSFSRTRVLFPSVVLGMAMLYLVSIGLGAPVRPLAYATFAALIGLMAWRHVAVARRLRTLDMPEAYRRAVRWAGVLTYAGLAVFIGCLIVALTIGSP